MLNVPKGKMTSSIINEVLGPIMRGPSSSHTAGSWRIAAYARSLLAETPLNMAVVFEDMGTYADVCFAQRADLGFIAGALGVAIMDDQYDNSYEIAKQRGFSYTFDRANLPGCDHPNELSLTLRGAGKSVNIRAQSTGGGTIHVKGVNGFAVASDSILHDVFVQLDEARAAEAMAYLEKGQSGAAISVVRCAPLQGEQPLFSGAVMLQASYLDLPDEAFMAGLAGFAPGYIGLAPAIFYPKKGQALFSSLQEIVDYCAGQKCSFGEAARRNEISLLGLSPEEADRLMLERLNVMLRSVEQGLAISDPKQLIFSPPDAKGILTAEAAGKTLTGGIHLRAGARAIAAMQQNSSWGIVCAAPTAGSAGVMPGVVSTMQQDLGKSESEILAAMWAAGGIGMIFNSLATFAAEVGGCQVEIGAAGAMSTGMLLDMAGATPKQVMDGAAVYMQNNMGLVCDPVQGYVETPCLSRNAVAAAGAFFCTDLILGGFTNIIPFDETVLAVYSVGKMLPRELRCTALGGLALTPSAINAKPNK
ncbi:MAG: L-serine ammonia-lyase, iron-sulfur-dependent, subunit alpha [Deltaproteobacteria bacterium]|jgi:L-serine dehydratase|nr:L-serine ammonia-lyase, iron-sulfur-dependent, subunit alpha [Deltaproteobacteria bacterium]